MSTSAHIQQQPMPAGVSALSAHLAGESEELAQFLADFVAVPSVTGDEGAAAEFLEAWLLQHDFEVTRHHISPDDLERWPDCADEKDLDARPNIVATLRSPNPVMAPVVLNGHIDVVPTGDVSRWTRAPFSGERSGGRIYGRGSSDMKGGIAAGLFAVRALRDAGVALPFDIEIQCVVAEESGGLGTLSLMRDRPMPAAAIILEPTETRIVTACGGAQPFTVDVIGKAAHVGRPWTGVDALDKVLLVHDRLRRLEAERSDRLSHPLFDQLPRKAPLSVGRLEAGEWRLTIPDVAHWFGRIGTLPFETISDVRAEVVAAVADLASDPWLRDNPCVVRFDGPGFAGWETDATADVVGALAASVSHLTGDPTPSSATYGSDAAVFAQAGVPSVLFGPGSMSEAHCKDESVDEAEVTYAAQAVAMTLAQLGDSESFRSAHERTRA
jgi:acetylornithine deacetylase